MPIKANHMAHDFNNLLSGIIVNADLVDGEIRPTTLCELTAV